ncbi:alpha/beta hydrolase [Kaistella flava (ex Peng et al. 2021)]|uniref:Alpha/beta hydrolase n=1 Tax=Kaistella flava (ex Peng et al. 2021) TaxID=2038776 RepID=A0A7M2Y9T1_9FLAO|nr:alpha/beta hydrolase [Kaistella flava (ex Peng et al. 2021)]QOW10415.1 alpha/beta hydrolase [Kaistella flava (ex Peng et al. 2021)]
MDKKNYCLVLFLICFSSFSQNSLEIYKPVAFPKDYSSKLNTVYTKEGDWEGKVDLYINANLAIPTPIIINIHGGGWKKGVKESQTGFNAFFEAGFAVANMEYRLSSQATAPAAIEDTRCMLIYLINHASELNIDPKKIVIMGGSAGGHLALMGGLLENDHRFDTKCMTQEKIKVAAIIDKYGISDLYDWSYGKLKSKSALEWLGTKASDYEFIESVSPINYITKNSPPTFIVHGDADPTVPYQQSVNLYNKLQKNMVESEFITVKNGLHGKFDKEKNKELNIAIIKFLSKYIN